MPRGFPRWPGWLVVGALVAPLAGLAPDWPPTVVGAQPETNCDPPTDSEWIVDGTVVCADRTILVRNVTVWPTGSLTLHRVTLEVNALFWNKDKTEGHAVSLTSGSTTAASAKLYAYDSLLKPRNPAYKPSLGVQLDTTLHLVRSTVQGFHGIIIGGSVEQDFTGRTLFGEVLFQDSRFEDVDGIIDYSAGTNVRILNNFIDGSWYGIYTEGSPTIENNTIVNCGVGIEIKFDAAKPKIAHNTITGCGAGISQVNSQVTQAIRDNDVYENRNRPLTAPDPCGNAAFYGDGTNNWWGQDPPDTSCFKRSFTYNPWRTSPAHPERLPTASLAPVPSLVGKNATVGFDASGSRPSTAFGFSLASYAWSFGDGATATGPQVSHAWTAPGTYPVTVTVRDEKGLSRSTSTTVTVQNRDPRVDAVAITPVFPDPGDALVASASASDPDGDAVTLSYAWERNGQVQGDLAGPTVPGNRVGAGEAWRVTVVPHDGTTAGAPASASVQVPAPPPPTNRPPAVDALVLEPAPPSRSTGLRALAAASDPDGDAVAVAYAWARNDVAQPDLAGPTVAGARLTRGEVWRVTVLARDAYGAQASRSLATTVGNAVPVLSTASASPGTVPQWGRVDFHAAASDADGDALSYQWALPDGRFLQGADAYTRLADAGQFQVYVQAADARGGVAGTTVAVNVTATSGSSPSPTASAPASSGASPSQWPAPSSSPPPPYSPPPSSSSPGPSPTPAPSSSPAAGPSAPAPLPVPASPPQPSLGASPGVNAAPWIDVVAPEAGAAFSGLVGVRGVVGDPDGDPVTVTALVGNESRGVITNGVDWEFPLHAGLLPPGPVSVRVDVWDGRGGHASVERSLVARPAGAGLVAELSGGDAPGLGLLVVLAGVLGAASAVAAPWRRDPRVGGGPRGDDVEGGPPRF